MEIYNKQQDYYQKKEEFVNEVIKLYVIYQNELYITQATSKWIIIEIIEGLIDYIGFLGEKFRDDYITHNYLLGLQKNIHELEKLANKLEIERDTKQYQVLNKNIQVLIDTMENGLEETKFSIAILNLNTNQTAYIIGNEFNAAKQKTFIRKMY